MASDADRIVGLYQRNAHAWAADRGKTLFETAWLDRFLAVIPVDGAVLDLGCGAGEPIARYVMARGRTVTGIDSSPDMIAMCRENLPAQDWHVADMRTLSPGRRFSGVLAWDSFFHLCHDDQRAMFPIFDAHAMPRAALMFTSGPGHGVAMGAYMGEPLYHASLDAAEYRALLDANGFDVVAHAVEDPTCGRHTIWLAQHR